MSKKLLELSDLEEDDRCYVFGCTGRLCLKPSEDGEPSGTLFCNKCDVEIPGEDNGSDRH
jgi:hypothetical protein